MVAALANHSVLVWKNKATAPEYISAQLYGGQSGTVYEAGKHKPGPLLKYHSGVVTNQHPLHRPLQLAYEGQANMGLQDFIRTVVNPFTNAANTRNAAIQAADTKFLKEVERLGIQPQHFSMEA